MDDKTKEMLSYVIGLLAAGVGGHGAVFTQSDIQTISGAAVALISVGIGVYLRMKAAPAPAATTTQTPPPPAS